MGAGAPGEFGDDVAVTVEIAGVELGPGRTLRLVPTQPGLPTLYLGQTLLEARLLLLQQAQLRADLLDLAASCQAGQPAAVLAQPGLIVGDP